MRRVGLAAVMVACSFAAPAQAQAQGPPVIDTTGGKTQPVFGYADAIRERVFIESPYDSDKNGVKDIIAIDIKRPKATNEGLKAPVVMDPSPYYSTLGRGNESQLKRDVDGDGLLDLWPLFYDNYFVPRGYAVILMDMIGTNNSTGCPTVHDESDNLSAKVVIDWLNGRTKGVDKNGVEVKAPWHNGKTGLIGKSYDGTLANAVAASGVEGLSTIVPISAIASYYDYTRTNGVVQRGNHYLPSLASAVTNPDRRAYCLPVRNELSAGEDDVTGDYNDFWAVRDYLKDLDKVKASVFITHGIQDENVRADHFSKWWYGLKARNVPRKLWILRQGHVDPFDGRRSVWVDTIHRWFDYWLQGVPNGIMNEPAVDIEESVDNWKTYSDWPVPGTQMTDVYLRGTTATDQGELGGASGGATDSLTFRDANLSENNMLSLTNTQANKRTFLGPPLKQSLRMSGHRDRRPAGFAEQDAVEPDGADRRLRREHPDHAQRRRHLHARRHESAEDVLGRAGRQRRAVLHRDHQAAADRHAVARHQGHAGLLEPQLAADRGTGHDRGQAPLHLARAAGGLHVRRRPPDRDRDRGQLLGLRLGQRHDADRHHARHEAVEGLAADRRRL